jgi:TM2 domain-containing membrane protein YozV
LTAQTPQQVTSPSGAATGQRGVLPGNVDTPAQPATRQIGYSSPQVIVIRSGKSAGLAAVLSFLWCGLGQIYNGQIGKGVALICAYVVSWFLLFIVIGFITTPLLWIYGMVDAYRTAERLNQEAGLS